MTTAAFTPSDVAHWDTLDHGKFADEKAAVAANLERVPLDAADRAEVLAEAIRLVEKARGANERQGVVESFLNAA